MKFDKNNLVYTPTANNITKPVNYDNTVKESFPVLNMHCAACANNAQRILNQQEGVVNASVNFANTTAIIEYAPQVIQPDKLKDVLLSAGYELVIDKEENTVESLEAIQNKKLKTLKRKCLVAILFSIPLVIIAMFLMHIPYANYIMWILATPVVFYSGNQFFSGAYKQARNKSMNMDTLVALSTGVAYLFSVFNTLFPEFWLNKGLDAHVYFEASAVIITFILLGKLLEENAKAGIASSVKKLMGLQPKTVTVLRPDNQQDIIPINQLSKGSIILVKPGEKIAVDGTIVSGHSFVDESMISGEPVAIEKNEGDYVFSGTINQKGSFRFKAEKVGNDTLLAQIIRTVQDAQSSKVPVQKLADKIVGIFVPVIILLSIITFILWLLLDGNNGFIHGLLGMITVLIIACPCALGLATPTAIMVGIGKGAENGILIKNAESLELAKQINTMVFDKTGTITEGKPEVTNILWSKGQERKAVILASLEKQSEHPLAEAIVKYIDSETNLVVEKFESITGAGAKAIIDGQVFYAGNMDLLNKNNISISSELKEAGEKWNNEAKTTIWFTDEKQALAVVAISDQIKQSSIEAIRQLHSMGIETWMLTGDNAFVAKEIAMQAGIKNFHAGVLPQDKARYIKELQSQGKIVAMAGDGINDSGALAQADVSIAMGKGSDIAMDVANMTIISNDLTKIPQAIKLSIQTIRTIRQNLFWAFIYNMIGIPLAAGILYPINGFLLNPMIAGIAMALSSISVVGNSLRIKFLEK